MKQETTYPKLNELLGGLGNLVPDTDNQQSEISENEVQPDNSAADESWELFRTNLALYNFREKKDERMVYKLDRDLADSLDECDIDRKCRSDIVNAIVRTFINRHIDRLRQFRKSNRSLLDNT